MSHVRRIVNNWPQSLFISDRTSTNETKLLSTAKLGLSCLSLSLVNSCSVERSRTNRFHSLHCLLLMLFQWPFAIPNPTGFDVRPSSVTFSFALLSPSDNYYLALIRAICCSLDCQWKSALRMEMKTTISVQIYKSSFERKRCTKLSVDGGIYATVLTAKFRKGSSQT